MPITIDLVMELPQLTIERRGSQNINLTNCAPMVLRHQVSLVRSSDQLQLQATGGLTWTRWTVGMLWLLVVLDVEHPTEPSQEESGQQYLETQRLGSKPMRVSRRPLTTTSGTQQTGA